MAADGDASLSLREVEERFTASAAALEAVKANLADLDSFKELQRHAAGQLESIADHLHEHVQATTKAVEAVTSAQQAAESAFSSLAKLVEDSNAQVLQQAIARLDSNLAKAVDELKAAIDDSAAAKRERDAATSELQEVRDRFERLKAAAGSRAMRKAGLDESGDGGSPLPFG